MVESRREIGDKIARETRFYIIHHRSGVAGLHWVMDMVFRDDECRVRTDHAPANFTTIKHIALNLIRKAPGKDSFRLKRKWPHGTMSSSQASSPHDSFTRFPWQVHAGAIVLRRAATWSNPIPIAAAKRRIVSFVLLGATTIPACLKLHLPTEMITIGPTMIVQRRR
jgi:hypothetical protein